jgi:hypothetical protein
VNNERKRDCQLSRSYASSVQKKNEKSPQRDELKASFGELADALFVGAEVIYKTPEAIAAVKVVISSMARTRVVAKPPNLSALSGATRISFPITCAAAARSSKI